MHWATHTTRLWVMLVLLLGSVLLPSAPMAHAAGTLTASPTVVKVISQSKLGKTTLTWSAIPMRNPNEHGCPSVDPTVFFKLQLVMFFEGLRSERELVRVAAIG